MPNLNHCIECDKPNALADGLCNDCYIRFEEGTKNEFIFHKVEDKTVNNLMYKFSKRAIISNKKHGDTINEVQKTTRQWVKEALEEAMDQCVYLQRLLEKIDNESIKP
tara:strand:- start:956 stop:1279 length:324 start_codon:yes stop_codon:yes gene_type:complete